MHHVSLNVGQQLRRESMPSNPQVIRALRCVRSHLWQEHATACSFKTFNGLLSELGIDVPAMRLHLLSEKLIEEKDGELRLTDAASKLINGEQQAHAQMQGAATPRLAQLPVALDAPLRNFKQSRNAYRALINGLRQLAFAGTTPNELIWQSPLFGNSQMRTGDKRVEELLVQTITELMQFALKRRHLTASKVGGEIRYYVSDSGREFIEQGEVDPQPPAFVTPRRHSAPKPESELVLTLMSVIPLATGEGGFTTPMMTTVVRPHVTREGDEYDRRVKSGTRSMLMRLQRRRWIIPVPTKRAVNWKINYTELPDDVHATLRARYPDKVPVRLSAFS